MSIVGNLVGGIAGSLIGADAQRSASNKASDAQVRATQIATDEQKRQYDLYREDQKPYREAGYGALAQLQQLLGLAGDKNAENYGSLLRQFSGADLANDPGYQFGLSQGQRAIESSASARGGLYSGATMKALQRYGQDYGGTKFNEAFNRDMAYRDSVFNRLSGISGTGQTATQSVGAAGQNMANNVSDYAIQAGNARAANHLNQGNILSNLSNGMFGGGGSGQNQNPLSYFWG